MNYSITVLKHGTPFCTTVPHSIHTVQELRSVYAEYIEQFLEVDGYCLVVEQTVELNTNYL